MAMDAHVFMFHGLVLCQANPSHVWPWFVKTSEITVCRENCIA